MYQMHFTSYCRVPRVNQKLNLHLITTMVRNLVSYIVALGKTTTISLSLLVNCC